MAYCTLANLLERYGETEILQLTDRAALGMVDEALVEAAIGRAGQDIDGALADAGYTTPIAGWSRLQLCAECLARAYLYTVHRPDYIQDEYRECQAWLAKVSEGKIRPPGTVAEPGETPAGGAPEHGAPDRVFDADTLEDY